MPLHVSSTMCLSSGGQNCIIQPLVSSHSVGGRPVHRLREDTKSLGRFLKNTQISNFIIIRLMGAELFHVDGRTDIHEESNTRF